MGLIIGKKSEDVRVRKKTVKMDCECGKCNCELNNNEKIYFPNENIDE